ncbi:MAG: hypothetical protein LBM38_06600 [Clostridiales bacterium]|jgi:hypothetical protein|nr:hypothetical protein [Clostridiales bacterium]
MEKTEKMPLHEKRAKVIAQKEHLTNVFLIEFVVAFIYCLLVFIHMAIFSPYTVFATKAITWQPIISGVIFIVCVLLMYYFKKMPKTTWWRTFTYFWLGTAIGGGVLFGWTKLTSIYAWGGTWKGLQWMYALVGLYFLGCIIKYAIKYNRIKIK